MGDDRSQKKEKPLTIAVDLTSLGERMSGLERYAYRITEELVRMAPQARFLLVVRNRVPALLGAWRRFSNVRFCVVKGRNKLFLNQVRLPAVMTTFQADRYLFPAFPVPFFFRDRKTFGLIADMSFFDCPETMKQRSMWFFRLGAIHTAGVCKKVLTISHFSEGRIRKILGLSKEHILCAPCAADPNATIPGEEEIRRLRAKYQLPEKYWLTLCTLEPRKNLSMLVRAYRELTEEGVQLPHLVLAGREGWKNRGLNREMKKTDRSDPGLLHRIGEVPDGDLPALYAGADCFLFPSNYEGFGMPPLEAQNYGVRKVVVSDIPALKEVMGDTAFYFRNNDLRSLKQALLQAGIWKGCKEEKMRRNVARFSWYESARKIWEEMQ